MMQYLIAITTLIIVLILGFASFVAFNNLFTFEYLLVEYNLNRLKEPQQYPAASLMHFAKQCSVEYFYVMGKFYLYPLKFADLNLNVKVKDPKYAILLIHGFNRNQTDWLWFRNQIAALQYPVYTVNLSPELGSIQEITNTSITPLITKIKQETNCDNVILIGHSMGGLVASYYSEYVDKTGLIAKIMCIASPLHGTKLSVLAAGDNAQQMLPDATFTNELRTKIAASHKQYNFVASRFDNIVFPWQSELPNSGTTTDQLVMDFTSHLALLHSPRVVQQVKEWIAAN